MEAIFCNNKQVNVNLVMQSNNFDAQTETNERLFKTA